MTDMLSTIEAALQRTADYNATPVTVHVNEDVWTIEAPHWTPDLVMVVVDDGTYTVEWLNGYGVSKGSARFSNLPAQPVYLTIVAGLGLTAVL